MFADDLPDCPGCGEKWCPKHRKHYADCKCIGPTQEGVHYIEIKGKFYGKIVSLRFPP